LYGYSNRFQQLFLNLFINAADAITHSDGKISINGNETNEHITIKITDNGKGIEKENLEKIFDPFFTTKAPGEGTGLGLSISYNIIKEHYGEINVESKLNKGTSFTMTFPLKSPLKSMKI
jgi:signal transduction histidine kinase